MSGSVTFPCDVPIPGKVKYPGAEGYIYVIEFCSGIIKVGKATNPRSRIGMHASDAIRMGRQITRSWISSVHENYHDNELLLITYGNRRGTVTAGLEYFTGISYKVFRRYAKSLPVAPLDHASHQRHLDELRKQAAAKVKAWIGGPARRLILPASVRLDDLPEKPYPEILAAWFDLSPDETQVLMDNEDVCRASMSFLASFRNAHQDVLFLEQALAGAKEARNHVISADMREMFDLVSRVLSRPCQKVYPDELRARADAIEAVDLSGDPS